jgi:hypothetical protein
MSNTLSVHAKRILDNDVVPVRRIAEKVCDMMYGTEKRTKITIGLSVASLFFAVYLQHLASTGVCQAVGLK